jgi:hypothetical protein
MVGTHSLRPRIDGLILSGIKRANHTAASNTMAVLMGVLNPNGKRLPGD